MFSRQVLTSGAHVGCARRVVRALALIALLFSPAVLAQPRPLLVSAATSLTDVLEEVAKSYAAAGGGLVRFNFGGSNALARQIVNGAPADVFISADEAQMDVVQKAGSIVPGSRIDLVSNRLVVAAPADRAAFVRARFADAPPEIRRLALGDPEAVPAGVYARRYLESKGLWKPYEPRIVPSANVRAALVAVENGAADAAIVYLTDMSIARTATIAFEVPPDQGPRIVYPAAVVARSSNADEAKRFLAFAAGREAAEIFRRYKFQAAGPR
jgi:molybdate transport system substrate-binding protein